ncbi:MAG TPA: DUF4038 domain-containing protein [Luteitalea sp.]|nr:DUF4038 domain-containing protein [Luteitalea sp.]
MSPRRALGSVLLACVVTTCASSLHAQEPFPLRPSDNGRFLVDASGRPFPILGRTAWFMALLSTADVAVFLGDTKARGFNTVELALIGHDPRGRHAPFDDRGAAPFLKRLDGQTWSGGLEYGKASAESPDFTTPNEAYWRGIDALLADLEARGMLALVFPAYVGYAGNTNQGWMGEMVANGPDRMRTYGEFIARRYAGRKNLVWMLGGDFGEFDPAQSAAERGLVDGLLRGDPAGAAKLRSAEWSSETIGTDQPEFGSLITLNGAYTFDGYTADHTRRAYAVTPVRPAFLLEEPYDEEAADGTNVNRRATQPVRRFQWWGWLGSIGGYVAGNGYVWPFAGDAWRTHLDTAGSRDLSRLNAFIRGLAWHTLVPSGLGGMRELITKNGSTSRATDYIAAAAALDGSLLVAYVPPDGAGTFEVDVRAMRRTARARWFDPADGSWKAVDDAVPNAAPHTFRLPGRNAAKERDWVLVLDAPPPDPMATLR